jgi:hypothetical protein
VNSLVRSGVFEAEPELFVRNRSVVVSHFDRPGQNNFFDDFSCVREKTNGAINLGKFRIFPGLGDENYVCSLPSGRRRLALMIAVKATTTLSGINFNAVLGMWSGPGAVFTFSDPIISRISSGEVGVMGVSFGSERISSISSIDPGWRRRFSACTAVPNCQPTPPLFRRPRKRVRAYRESVVMAFC